MFLSNKHLCFLLIFVVFTFSEAAKNAKNTKSLKKARNPSLKATTSKFTVPLYFAARGPSVSAAEYLNRVYPGIRYAELSKTEAFG